MEACRSFPDVCLVHFEFHCASHPSWTPWLKEYELFLETWLKEYEPSLETWLKEYEPSLETWFEEFEPFLETWLKEYEPSLETWFEEFEPFLETWLKEFELFLEHVSQNWTFFNMIQRIDPLFNMTHWIEHFESMTHWFTELNPLNTIQRIEPFFWWMWRKNWTFWKWLKRIERFFFFDVIQRIEPLIKKYDLRIEPFWKVWLRELNILLTWLKDGWEIAGSRRDGERAGGARK